MYMLFSVVCQLFICICYSLALYYLAVVILDQKPEKRCYFIFSITFTLLQVIANLLYASASEAAEYNIEISTFVWNIVLYSGYATILAALLIRAYHINAARTAVAVAISHFAVFTMILIVAEYMFAKVSPDGNFVFYLIMTTIFPHLFGLAGAVLVAKLLKRGRFHQYFHVFFENTGRSVITVIFCVVLMHYHTLAGLILPVETGSTSTALYSGTFLVLMLFVLQFAAGYTADREKIKAQSDTILQLQTHLALLEELQQEMRAFRHDFTNLLAGVSRQAADGDLKGIQEFMQNTGAYFDEKLGNEIQHLECISNIKIYPLRSLITAKMAKLQEQEIACLFEAPNPVTNSGMRTEDLLRCIGILIDNAMEAAAGSREKTVKIILLQRPGELYAAVSNTCAKKPDLVKMREKGYSSKGRSRGTGLTSLRRITGEYPRCMTRMRVEDHMFIQEIRIVF